MIRTPKKQKKIRVSGIIVPSSWDATGRYLGYNIATIREREYRLVSQDEEIRLDSFSGKSVIVSGLLIDSKPIDVIYIDTIKTA